MVLFALLLAAMSGEPSAPQCSVDDASAETRVANLPPVIREQLPAPLADAGAPFRATDAVLPGQEQLPTHRLVCGYLTTKGYVVEQERGGRGHGIERLIFRRTKDGYILDQ